MFKVWRVLPALILLFWMTNSAESYTDTYRVTRWTDGYNTYQDTKVVIGKLAPGQIVTASGEDKYPHYRLVFTGSRSYWVPKSALELIPDTEEPVPFGPATVVRWTTLFNHPYGTPQDVSLAPETPVVVIQCNRDSFFAEITHSGGSGWLSVDALDINYCPVPPWLQ